MTSAQIKKKLAKHGVAVSSSTVQRSRKQQGWTLQQTRYCQLKRDTNKIKRLEYAQQVLESGDTFHNVIFSDECSISLAHYRRTCYRKFDEPTKRKPKPKHPLIRERLPDHRFMQDNDPKHTSRRAQTSFEQHNINWWRTPWRVLTLTRSRTCGTSSSSSWNRR